MNRSGSAALSGLQRGDGSSSRKASRYRGVRSAPRSAVARQAVAGGWAGGRGRCVGHVVGAPRPVSPAAPRAHSQAAALNETGGRRDARRQPCRLVRGPAATERGIGSCGQPDWPDQPTTVACRQSPTTTARRGRWRLSERTRRASLVRRIDTAGNASRSLVADAGARWSSHRVRRTLGARPLPERRSGHPDACLPR
jgi:hypothetical protein